MSLFYLCAPSLPVAVAKMDVNFTALAPRYGTHPMTNSFIGTSGMSGGAFNWGGVWSGLKNFGSKIKTWGNKVYNSNTGQAIRQKLKDTGAKEKLISGIATGVNGALDIAQAELAQRIQNRLERYQPQDPVEVEEIIDDGLSAPEVVPPSKAEEVVELTKKRPRDEDLVLTEMPPSYEEAVAEKPLLDVPMTRPVHPLARPVLPAPPAYQDTPTTLELKPRDEPLQIPAPVVAVPSRAPVRASRGWKNTLNDIVGVGLRGVKRRRCYY